MRSNYVRTEQLDEELGGVAFASAATLYFALVVGDPSGAGVEVSGSNYARVAITNDLTSFPAASGTPPTKSLGVDVDFPEPSGSWGTPTYWAMYDAASGGNLRRYGAITTPVAITSGMLVRIAAGSLIFTG